MGNKNKSKRTKSFLISLENIASIESKEDIIAKKLKFNFSYFTVDGVGQDFKEWDKKQLYELFEKLNPNYAIELPTNNFFK